MSQNKSEVKVTETSGKEEPHFSEIEENPRMDVDVPSPSSVENEFERSNFFILFGVFYKNYFSH